MPRTLSLLEMLTHYLDFQREIVTRRSKHELRQKEKRAHILQGYLIALDNLDAVIALIRAAADTEAAGRADGAFDLSELQASRSSNFVCAPSPRSSVRASRGVPRHPGAHR